MSPYETSTLDEAQQYLLNTLDSECSHGVICPFVRRHGQFFVPSALPQGIRRGSLGVCFANSFKLLKRHGERLGLAYVEGYAVSVEPMYAHLHAWCVDQTGKVYDPTWKTGKAYFGIKFKDEFVRCIIREREMSGDVYYGILNDWKKDFPLIRKFGENEQVWKG